MLPESKMPSTEKNNKKSCVKLTLAYNSRDAIYGISSCFKVFFWDGAAIDHCMQYQMLQQYL